MGVEEKVKLYIGSLILFSVALASSWIYWYGVSTRQELIIGAIIFAVLLCLARIFPIQVTEKWEIDAADVLLISSVVVLGPIWATLASVPYNFIIGRRDPLRTIYEVSNTTVFIFLAGIASSLFGNALLIEPDPNLAISLYATFATGLLLIVVNNLINLGLLKIKYDQSLRQSWEEQIEPYLLSDVINLTTSALGILALLVYGPVAAIVVVVGAVASQILVYRTKENVRETVELKERIASLEESLSISNLTFGAMMIEDLGRQDGYTHLHAAATSVYCADIASELNLEPETAARLEMAGLLHNIGMFGMPRELLSATGSLNSIAKARIREHPERGEAALASVPEFSEMAKWVRWHHERPDGRGYPDRLRANWIPLQSRILAVAQAYAAMVLDQPRRPGLAPPAAREQLNLGAGSQFDEVVVRAFLRILDTESEGYRSADDHRFGFGLRNRPGKLENTAD